MLGYESTVPVTVDELLMLTRAVRRGLKTPMLVGDLPFGSYEASDEQAVLTAQRFVKEAGCDAVKLEGGGTSVQRARAIVNAGIPVMGHVGLTPQTATSLGGYRAQGRTAERASQVMQDALELQAAGCFAVVFEAIPTQVTDMVMEHMDIVVIGIGAGPATDGQVLVLHDLLAVHRGHVAKFVRQFADVRSEMDARGRGVRGSGQVQGVPGRRARLLDPARGARAAARRGRRGGMRRRTTGSDGYARARHGAPVTAVHAPRAGVLRPLRGGGGEHRPRRRACSRRCSSPGRRSPSSPARSCSPSRRATGSRTTSSTSSTRRSSRRSTARTSSRSPPGLDDILDFTEEVADFLGLYRIEAPMDQAIELAKVLHQASRQVAEALPRLRTQEDVSHYVVEIHRLENDGDRMERMALASLFERAIDPMVVIRWKDIFERLEQAVDATENVANTIQGIVLKNS